MASLSDFGIRIMVASENEFSSFPSSTIFWKNLNRIDISSLNFLAKFAVKPSDPGLFLLEKIVSIVFISVIFLKQYDVIRCFLVLFGLISLVLVYVLIYM